MSSAEAHNPNTANRNNNKVKYFNGIENSTFSGYRLVLPAVSDVGNVGQLATDLLLENLSPRPVKIGQIFHDGLEPIVGLGGDGSLMTATELFQHVDGKIVILQFHSPVTRKSLQSFVTFLVEWIKESKFQDVLCLGSSFASLRNDIQLSQPSIRYLAGDALHPNKIRQIKNLGWIELESIQSFSETGKEPSTSVTTSKIEIPGGGIARDLFVACNTARIPILTLILFASDGDNTPESLMLMRSANEVYQFFHGINSPEELKLRIPPSWKYINGSNQPDGIF